jgi:hypothetical protein
MSDKSWCFRVSNRILYALISGSVLILLDRCWRLVFLVLLSTLWLLVFESLVAAVLVLCRHFYYRKYAVTVEARRVVDVADDNNDDSSQQENQTILGTLQEAAFCEKWGKRCVLEFETTGFVGVASGMEERRETCYGTLRVRKVFRVPYKVPESCHVMVLPGNPASAIVLEPQFSRIVVSIPVLVANTLLFSSGVFIPLYFFGYFDDDSCTQHDGQDDDIIRCLNGCQDWEVQVAYVLTAVLASLLVKINSVTDSSNVVVIADDQPFFDQASSAPTSSKTRSSEKGNEEKSGREGRSSTGLGVVCSLHEPV